MIGSNGLDGRLDVGSIQNVLFDRNVIWNSREIKHHTHFGSETAKDASIYINPSHLPLPHEKLYMHVKNQSESARRSICPIIDLVR